MYKFLIAALAATLLSSTALAEEKTTTVPNASLPDPRHTNPKKWARLRNKAAGVDHQGFPLRKFTPVPSHDWSSTPTDGMGTTKVPDGRGGFQKRPDFGASKYDLRTHTTIGKEKTPAQKASSAAAWKKSGEEFDKYINSGGPERDDAYHAAKSRQNRGIWKAGDDELLEKLADEENK